MNLLVAVHQPNFFPWRGYFSKLRESDVFVILDDSRQGTGSTWFNRTQLIVADNRRWITADLDRSSYKRQKLNNTRFVSSDWRLRAKNKVFENYRQSPFFDSFYPVFAELLAYPDENVCNFNLFSIKTIAAELSIDTRKIVKSSTLEIDSVGTNRIVDIVKAVGGGTYISGFGGEGYIEDQKFSDSGIALKYQNFKEVNYNQGERVFIPGLSIVDTIFWNGWDETRLHYL